MVHRKKPVRNLDAPRKVYESRDEEDKALFLAALDKMDDSVIKHKASGQLKTEGPVPKKSSKSGVRTESIDLHGMTVAEAQNAVDQLIQLILRQSLGTVKLRVITGKGLHSGHGGGVLARDVYSHVSQRYRKYIQSIDESPADVKVGGVPIRGHFDVLLKR